MDKTRKIRKVIKGRPVLEGAGVRLKRLFGFGKGSEFDPFLLLDDFRADDPRDYITEAGRAGMNAFEERSCSGGKRQVGAEESALYRDLKASTSPSMRVSGWISRTLTKPACARASRISASV